MFNEKKTIHSVLAIVIVFSSFTFFLQNIKAATPPTVLTVAASDITDESVTLNGNITNDGDSPLATRYFQYGETTEYEILPEGTIMMICDPFDGCPLGAYSESFSEGLVCEREYHYQAYATNEAGEIGYGEDMTFTTDDCPLPTIVTTLPATGIGLNSATLNGVIDFTEIPLNQVGFSISLTDSPNPLAEMNFVYQETENQPYEMGETFSLTMNNLSCSSTYTYNAHGGDDVVFDTLSCDPPVVETGEPVITEEPIAKTPLQKIFAFFIPFVIAAPGDTIVQLNGNVIDTGGENPVAGFEYGIDTSYGTTLEVGTFGVESYSTELSFLEPNIEYHYRAYATNSTDTSVGEDRTFIIAGPVIAPSVTTNEATSVGKNSATFNGEITNIGGENPTVRGFDYGLTDSYGMNIEETDSFPGESFSSNISGLSCNTLYHYRAYATNSADRGEGGDQTFETSNCSTVGYVVPPPDDTIPLPDDTIPPPPDDTIPPPPDDTIPPPDDTIPPPDDTIPPPPDDTIPPPDDTISPPPDTRDNPEPIDYIPPYNLIMLNLITLFGVMQGVYLMASTLFAGPVIFNEITLLPVRFWGLLLGALGLKKRKKVVPWGTVYDSVTKQPLDPAYVVLEDLAGNEVATSITDLDGRYGFMVPPGKYKILVNKTNYIFPSKKLSGKNEDVLYRDLYFNEIVEIEEGGVITKNIPMDSTKFDWNEFAKKDKKVMKFFSTRELWATRISNFIFFFGFLFAIIATILSSLAYNIVILIIYLLVILFKDFIFKPRANGYVREKINHIPLSFALIRVFRFDTKDEITHKITDKTGKYYCLIPNGKYYVKIEKKVSDENYSLVYTSPYFEVKKGYINKKFEI